jgi:predicted Zn finger-like uncharacterized protein
MSDEKFTRCPGCRTVFRVTPAQLALREGQVRCGHCRTVFDGAANLINVLRTSPAPSAADEGTGPLTVTLRVAHALEPAPPESPAEAPQASATAATASASVAGAASVADAESRPQAQGGPAPGTREEVDYDHRFAWDRPRRRSRAASALYLVGIVALVAGLVAQGVWHYRDAIAAHWPSTRPMLSGLCAATGCTIRPLREIAWLSIDASDLQADAAHRGLLTLTATVRNRANYAVALPHLELTLTDAQDNVVVRRALAPAEYAGGTVDVGAGIARNGEVAVKLFVDASATTQAGYRVYLFYP